MTYEKIVPRGTVDYLSSRWENGPSTNEMRSIQFACTRFCEALTLKCRNRNRCAFKQSLLRICWFLSFTKRHHLSSCQTPLEYLMMWQMELGSIASKSFLPRYILPNSFQLWLVDREVLVKILHEWIWCITTRYHDASSPPASGSGHIQSN